MRSRQVLRLLSVLPAAFALAYAYSVSPHGWTRAPQPAERHANPCQERDPERNVFFGDLHVHSDYSLDAYNSGFRLTPDDVYAFARGNTVQAGGGISGPVRPFRLARPLDFVALTDHAEFLSPAAGNVQGEEAILKVRRAAWRQQREAAERALDRSPGCRFTSFVGYEWSAAPPRITVPEPPPELDPRSAFVWNHRNVIFRSAQVPDLPIGADDAPAPEDLWRELRRRCSDAGMGCDVLAIPHTSNYSQGSAFDVPDRLAPEQARERARMEPLVEIYQVKGLSECKPGVGNDGSDAGCAFESLGAPVCTGKDAGPCHRLCGQPGPGASTSSRLRCEAPLGYVRNALERGLQLERGTGVNPLKMGFVASTDTHYGTPGAVEEANLLPRPRLPQLKANTAASTWQLGSGGLAAVWAEENSRDSLFAALRRRETYATSGPRMRVRFFGGWNLPADLCHRRDLVEVGYRDGVPMGSDLPAPPAGARHAPRFVVWARKDAGTVEQPGTPLQQVQIVKGWLDPATGLTHEAVLVVAGDPNNGAAVDPRACLPSGTGRDELCTVWSDPAFRPEENAFYYARVIENPSCRFTAYQCRTLPPAERPAICSDGTRALTLQERAWTSPIWYQP